MHNKEIVVRDKTPADLNRMTNWLAINVGKQSYYLHTGACGGNGWRYSAMLNTFVIDDEHISTIFRLKWL